MSGRLAASESRTGWRARMAIAVPGIDAGRQKGGDMAVRFSILGEAAGNPGHWVPADQGGRIGRARDNDWVLKDPQRYVSAHHAEVEERDGDWWLKDLSTNGTFVNGSSRPIGPAGKHRIADGDRIRIGSIEIVAEIVQAEELPSGSGGEPELSAEVKSLLSVEATGGWAARADAFGQRLPERHKAPRDAAAADANPTELWPGLVAFCRGAGIDPFSLPAAKRTEVLQEAGQAIRELVLGLKELSRSRAEFTRELGITEPDRQHDAGSTLLQVSATEEALIQLLTGSGPGASRAVDEVRHQFARTRHYQQSVIVALREALTAMLERLDPDSLERQFGGTTRGSAGVEEQARNWSRYRELHRAIAASDDTGLPAVFVEEFAHALRTLAEVGLRPTLKSGESG